MTATMRRRDTWLFDFFDPEWLDFLDLLDDLRRADEAAAELRALRVHHIQRSRGPSGSAPSRRGGDPRAPRGLPARPGPARAWGSRETSACV